MSGPRILFLIRHGRSDFSAEAFRETPRGRQWDPPLDETGREQAALLSKRLQLMDPPAAVYSSPFRRARETAEEFADRAGVNVTFDVDLGEAYIGAWEHRSFEDILASDERLIHKFRNQEPLWALAPGGERIEPFRQRVQSAIEGALADSTDGNVYVFCHGGVINGYVGPLLGLEHEMFFLPENTSLNSIAVEGAERRVRFLNDVAHLTDPHLFEHS